MTVEILALNLQHASASRLERQVQWLTDQDVADVLILSEVASGSRSDHLVHLLETSGYATTRNDHTSAGNQVAVALRRATTDGPVTVLHCTARFVHIATRIGNAQLEVVGLYVPSRGPATERNVAKRAFQQEITAALPAIADRARERRHQIVVAGDLNVVEPDHVPHHRLFGEWEYDFYRSFSDRGNLCDAFRSANGAKIDHSWFGRRSGLGYRFDHVFVSDGLSVVDCHYDHNPRQLGLSDHSAMRAVVRFSGAEHG
ncbi:MAG: endonuclease/exonuclease/phosphatase family protein [Tomitella sp.]|nr:endonuclease/exonuclease/phosphatase family protein [Tomitella sp.]